MSSGLRMADFGRQRKVLEGIGRLIFIGGNGLAFWGLGLDNMKISADWIILGTENGCELALTRPMAKVSFRPC